MAQQFPPPTGLSGLTEQDQISLGEQMYQMIMAQSGVNQQRPMGMRSQAMPQRQAASQPFRGGAGSLMNRPRPQGRIPGAFATPPMRSFSPFAQSVMQGQMGRQPMQARSQRQMPQRQMPRRQMSRRLPPPQAMNRFAPQGPMMQASPMAQGLYNPLGANFMPRQAPLMAFNPYQGIV